MISQNHNLINLTSKQDFHLRFNLRLKNFWWSQQNIMLKKLLFQSQKKTLSLIIHAWIKQLLFLWWLERSTKHAKTSRKKESVSMEISVCSHTESMNSPEDKRLHYQFKSQILFQVNYKQNTKMKQFQNQPLWLKSSQKMWSPLK